MKSNIPHCWRWNEILGRCSNGQGHHHQKCVNTDWIKKVQQKKGHINDPVLHLQRTYGLSSYEDAKKAYEYDTKVQFYNYNTNRINNEIREELIKNKPVYTVETIHAKYSPYMPSTHYDSYYVAKNGEQITEAIRNYSQAREIMEKYRDCDEEYNKEINMNEYRICPVCGNQLKEIDGKYGLFIGCSDYPNCTYSRKQWVEKKIISGGECD